MDIAADGLPIPLPVHLGGGHQIFPNIPAFPVGNEDVCGILVEHLKQVPRKLKGLAQIKALCHGTLGVGELGIVGEKSIN